MCDTRIAKQQRRHARDTPGLRIIRGIRVKVKVRLFGIRGIRIHHLGAEHVRITFRAQTTGAVTLPPPMRSCRAYVRSSGSLLARRRFRTKIQSYV